MGRTGQVKSQTTKRAIWVDDPMATPKARSIFPRYATVMAVACSAALPTIGMITKPMNIFDRPCAIAHA